MRLLIACLLSLGIASPSLAAPSSTLFNHVASCVGSIDGTKTALNFFEEMDERDDKLTGRGFFIQSMGNNEMSPKFSGHLVVKGNPTGKDIEMRAAINSKITFAKITIPAVKKDFKLNIFAIPFRQEWGNFECVNFDVTEGL